LSLKIRELKIIFTLRVIPACRQAGAFHGLELFTKKLGGKNSKLSPNSLLEIFLLGEGGSPAGRQN